MIGPRLQQDVLNAGGDHRLQVVLLQRRKRGGLLRGDSIKVCGRTIFHLDPEVGTLENGGSEASPWPDLEAVINAGYIHSFGFGSLPFLGTFRIRKLHQSLRPHQVPSAAHFQCDGSSIILAVFRIRRLLSS